MGGGRGGAGGEEIRTGDKFLQVSGLVWGNNCNNYNNYYCANLMHNVL